MLIVWGLKELGYNIQFSFEKALFIYSPKIFYVIRILRNVSISLGDFQRKHHVEYCLVFFLDLCTNLLKVYLSFYFRHFSWYLSQRQGRPVYQ